MRRRPISILSAGLALALAACGTTVPASERNAAARQQPGFGEQLDADDVDAGGAAGQDQGVTGATSGEAGAGSSATGRRVGATTATTPRAGTTTLPTTGPGWDKSTIYIGVTTQKDVQTAADSVGAKGLDGGDQEAQANAVVNDINRRGGLFGRQVKLVFKDQSTIATAQDPNTAGNQACTFFTEDRRVIALISPVTLMDVPSFRACMAKAKVPLFSASVAAIDQKVVQALQPYFYSVVAPTWDALAPVFVERLKAQGWFSGWNPLQGAPGPNPTKVGVLAPNDDTGGRVAKIVTDALSAAGYKNSVVYQYTATSDFSPAVLNFSGNSVTHVIAVNADLFPFQLSANTQNYNPRYGITSVNAPQTFLQSNSPRGQNTGAMGVGWSPSLDVDDTRDADTGPGEAECKRILKAGGQSFQGKRLAEAVAYAICDALLLIQQAATAGSSLLGTAIYDGVQRVGPSFNSALSFAAGLGPNRLFLPGGVRDLIWDTKCSCMRYPATTTHRL